MLPAAFKLAALNADQVRLTFIGHATFLIESPQGVRIATDYNDYREAAGGARHRHHESCARHPLHRSSRSGDQIRAARLGAEPEEPAIWDLKYRDVRVRNVPTNIRNWNGGTERYGNSIFIFEIANLCIAHLGHLHHTLTQQQLNEIGRVDVVMAPVDGNYTLDLDGMMEVLTALKAPLIIPMHFFGWATLERFLERAGKQWPVERSEVPDDRGLEDDAAGKPEGSGADRLLIMSAPAKPGRIRNRGRFRSIARSSYKHLPSS